MTDCADDDIYLTIEEIIRDDLKLGDTKVPRDKQLFDGDLGLDSLDALMLVTGVEKKLGIKLPNKKLGKDNMSTIDHFADFVSGEIRAKTS